jgi:chromosomal replication initiator protein
MESSSWKRLQSKLRLELGSDEFDTWFGPLKVRHEREDCLELLAPNRRFLVNLEESYRGTVDRAVAGLEGPGFRVLFSVPDPTAAVAAPLNLDATPTEDRTGPTEAPQSADVTRRYGTSPASSPFNPKYAFESFVVGSSNQFAHAAARAVAENPARSYNPLFLYGGVGLGKTHLLHAIGHHISALHSHLRVMYLPAEQFVNELISSLRFNRMPDFRERYRSIDILMVDDIQFLANKERTQEEFFHTFNTLYTGQAQIILSSESSPRNIPALEERLRSRFEWGLIADIQPPDLETRIAILRRKADLEDADLQDDVALFIAQQVKSNVRELEGMLNRVVAFSSLTGRPLSLELAKETLRDILPPEHQRVLAPEIIKLVARHYGLKVGEIKSRNNSKQIAFPRQVAMYLCKQLTDLSFPEIGKQFNNKHHSTVMYSVEKIEKLRSEDADLDRVLERLGQHFS